MQEMKVLSKIKRYYNDADCQDVLHKKEGHADTYRLAVGTDASHGSNSRTVIITDIRINRCEQWYQSDEAQG